MLESCHVRGTNGACYRVLHLIGIRSPYELLLLLRSTRRRAAVRVSFYQNVFTFYELQTERIRVRVLCTESEPTLRERISLLSETGRATASE